MKTILVVDDEFEIAEAIGMILEDEGYRVLSCGDGIEGLACVNEHKPDLVLLDVMMPLLGGLEVLRRLRADEATRTLPVIVMSAVEPRGDPGHLGWNEFLAKPFTLEQLLAKIERLLGKGEDAR